MSTLKRNLALIPTLLLTGLFALPAMAESVVHQVGVEADQINVTISKETGTGHARIQGCKQCPLELIIDASTVFHSRGKMINREQIMNHSGQAGLLTYDKESKRAMEINW